MLTCLKLLYAVGVIVAIAVFVAAVVVVAIVDIRSTLNRTAAQAA